MGPLTDMRTHNIHRQKMIMKTTQETISLFAKKGECCSVVTGFLHKPLDENAWRISGRFGTCYVRARNASDALAIYLAAE